MAMVIGRMGIKEARGLSYPSNYGNRQQYLPEVFANESGRWDRDSEKVKLIVDAPKGVALQKGDARAVVMTKMGEERLNDLLKMIPLHVDEEDCSKMMKIVTGYKCTNKGEYIQFAGDHETAWYPLDSFEILSTED